LILTNRLNLPELLKFAVRNDTYSNGGSWRTITELISPAKISTLKRRHENELTEDVVYSLYTMQGQIAHGIVERASQEMKDHGWISEQRLHKEVLGKKISGQFDLFHPATGELLDVKYSSGWSAKKGEAKPEWAAQTNLLALLLGEAGHNVKRIRILLLIRDWSKPEAARNPDYPQDPAVYLEVPVWSKAETENYLIERVRAHMDAETKLPECTPIERWAKPSEWAIRKVGNQRAIPGGVFADEVAAHAKLLMLGSGYEIIHRPGANTRCALYCPVNKFCDQFKQTQGVRDDKKRTG
jgi:hypothetical protein